ncbi:hypothetical protein M3B43_07425 [Nesterenkonia massiliensis]|uniref:Uncharacterized protein n=1 Tax=Nesterenkonia massiliensis TaxID=1232429 RepID=A0ABT2HR54_9MICC|nr:hypothetical protein [Nesterenkonia massiliensis]MCT1607158.1 hypothetical protein [Nesterenkonia massiliensis]
MAKRSKVQVRPNHKGIQKLLNDPGIQRVVDSEGAKVLDRLPNGYEIVPGDGRRKRYRVMVATGSPEGRRDNAKRASLLRALGGR